VFNRPRTFIWVKTLKKKKKKKKGRKRILREESEGG
jgi:hypothetical protein